MSESSLEWLCRQIVERSGSAILFSDQEGVIRLWNQGAEEMFGYPASEAVGQSLDVIIPDRLRGRHWAGYRESMASGATRYARGVLAVPAVRKDGTRLSIEFTIVLLRGASGSLLGAAAIIQDVTERWEREKAQRDRLARLEAELKRAGGGPAPG